MKEYKRIKVRFEVYSSLLLSAKLGLGFNIVNFVLTGVLITLLKPVEIVEKGTSKWIFTMTMTPFYSALALYFTSAIILFLSYLKMVDADVQRVLPMYQKKPNAKIMEIGIDFTEQPFFVEVIEPLGTYSNNWFIFFIIGMVVSFGSILLGLSCALFAAISVPLRTISLGESFSPFHPVIVLSIILMAMQMITLPNALRGLLSSFNLLEHGLRPNWIEDFQKTLEWKLSKSVTSEGQDLYNSWVEKLKVRFSWKHKGLSGPKKITVNLSREEVSRIIARYLSSKNAKIKLMKDSALIIAEQGKVFAFEPENTKKTIKVNIHQESPRKSTIYIKLEFSAISIILDSLSLLAIAIITAIIYTLNNLIGVYMIVLCLSLLIPTLVWHFLERDALARNLYLLLQSKASNEQCDSLRRKEQVSMLTKLAKKLADLFDIFYRTLYGVGIVEPKDFPQPPIYFYRDYRSNLNQYGKMKEQDPFEKESSSLDLGPISSRKESEIKIESRSNGRCDIRWKNLIIKRNLTNPLDLISKVRVIGIPSSGTLRGPWASFFVIGINIFLFVISLDSPDYIIPKWSFVLTLAFGIWIGTSAILLAMFDTFSELFHLPEAIKWIVTFSLFPLLVSVLNLLLPDIYYSLKFGINSWIISGILFGLLVAPHTTGKPYSRAIYFYEPEPESPFFPYKHENDAPYWLNRKSAYWVFRFVLQWLWEISIPPHRDYERLEVWINAKTGEVEWVVADFHYRELWYEVHGTERIIVLWDSIFHTFYPLTDQETIAIYEKMVSTSQDEYFRLDIRLKKKLKARSDLYYELHPSNKVKHYFHGLERFAASSCAKLPWKYWRYTYGAYPKKRNFSRWKKYAHCANCEGHPAAVPFEQFYPEKRI